MFPNEFVFNQNTTQWTWGSMEKVYTMHGEGREQGVNRGAAAQFCTVSNISMYFLISIQGQI